MQAFAYLRPVGLRIRPQRQHSIRSVADFIELTHEAGDGVVARDCCDDRSWELQKFIRCSRRDADLLVDNSIVYRLQSQVMQKKSCLAFVYWAMLKR